MHTTNYYVDASGLLMLKSDSKNIEIEKVEQNFPMETQAEIDWFMDMYAGDIDELLYLRGK